MIQVRRDTIKIARHNKLNIDTMSWDVDTSFVQANKKTFEAVMSGEVKHEQPKIMLTAFDTIVPCDVSLYPPATLYIPKTHNVRTQADIEMPMNYDILFNGIVFGFTLWMSVKYVLNSVPHWTNLISELKQELSKA
jgi:hypothetical protein